MIDKKCDTLSKMALRSRGLSVKQKTINYEGEAFTFKYMSGRYYIFIKGEMIDSIESDNINKAISDYMEQYNKRTQ
ncbi:hypothetical protein AOY81_23065 [Escherichia coli]|nr:hypothetical protein AOY81_23065 [Escherichia coli]